MPTSTAASLAHADPQLLPCPTAALTQLLPCPTAAAWLHCCTLPHPVMPVTSSTKLICIRHRYVCHMTRVQSA